MALTRGNRAQSRETSMIARGPANGSTNVPDLHEVSVDVGNSNIEISQSGIQPVSSSDNFMDQMEGNEDAINRSGGRRTKRLRNRDSRRREANDSYDYYDYTNDESGAYDDSYGMGDMGSRRAGKKRGRLQSIFSSIKSFFFTDGNESDADTSLRRRSRKRRKYHSGYQHSPGAHRVRLRMDGRDIQSLREGVLNREKRNRDALAGASQLHQQSTLAVSNTTLKNKVSQLESQLRNANEDLKFAREKNTLFERLLDEANIDRSYVKSRRDIRNLEKHNIKPRDELPPSPERKVNPLVTSSPIRRLSGGADNIEGRNLNLAPPQINFYSKYPTIPRTESLAMASNTSEPQQDNQTETGKDTAK